MTITRYRTGAGAGTRAGGRRCADGDSDGCRFAASRKFTALVCVLCFYLSNALGAQRPGARGPENPTPLGVQVPVEGALQKQRRGDVAEPASAALRRLGISNGNPDQSRTDMVADGTVTVHTASGPIAFGVTLIQNGEQGSQRILLRQRDGKLWDGRPDHLAPGAGPALEFLETQYRRGLQQLLKSPGRDSIVEDNGIKDSLRVVTMQGDNGQSTNYSLDPATSRIARFEFVRGQSPASIGNMESAVHSYSFADFRAADGIATPFHIEHSVNGVKKEELQLSKVRYDTAAIGAPAVGPTGR